MLPFFNEMAKCQNGMAAQHSRPGISHNISNMLAHLGFITVYFTLRTGAPSFRQMGISANAGRHIRVTVGNRGIIVSLYSHDDSDNISSTLPKESSVLVLICRVLVPYTFFSHHSCAVHNIRPSVFFYATAYPVSRQDKFIFEMACDALFYRFYEMVQVVLESQSRRR